MSVGGPDRGPGSTRGRLLGTRCARVGEGYEHSVPRHEGRRTAPGRQRRDRGVLLRLEEASLSTTAVILLMGATTSRKDDAQGSRGQPELILAALKRTARGCRSCCPRCTSSAAEKAGRRPGPRRAVPGGGEERRPGRGPRDPRSSPTRAERDGRRPTCCIPTRSLREVGSSTAPSSRPCASRDRPRPPLHPGGGFHEPVRRPRSSPAGLSPTSEEDRATPPRWQASDRRRRLALRRRARPLDGRRA